MIYAGIIAEITSKWDISGVFCLASILFLFIVLMAYSTGPWGGSCTCLFFFVIAVFATGDLGDAGSGSNVTPNKAFIANRSQTKMISRYKYSISDPDCIYSIYEGPHSGPLDNYAVFIPAEEMYTEDGSYKMRSTGQKPNSYDVVEPERLKDRDWSNPNGWVYGNWGNPDSYLYRNDDGAYVKLNTGRPPADDDYYLYDETIDPINAPVEEGGWGVPQWIYHPAAPTWIFGIAGLPALLGGMFVASKLFG